MNARTISVKDDSTDYVVYYPYPCTILPPIGLDIPAGGCQCLSIDPAIKNFAIRIEKRYATGYIETVYMVKLDLSTYGDVNESTGTTVVDPRILSALVHVLNQLLPWLIDCRIVAIERQMAQNYKSSRIYQHLLTYFMMIIPNFKNYCVLMDLSPKLKGRILGAPKGLNYSGLKQWGIGRAIEISTWRNDQMALEIIRQHKGKSKTKADDLCDTILQIEAWFKFIGGIHTSPPQVITIN